MLTAKQVSLQIGKIKLLENISLEIKTGECVALLGANGAGKSTLLKAFSGDLHPSHGSIHLDDKDVFSYKANELALKRAVMSQHQHMNFNFKVSEVVNLGRIPYKTSNTENEEICEEVMSLTSSLKFKGRQFLELSGGEKQRVHLARILAQIWGEDDKNKYLLLDEPTSSMDLIQQQQVFEIVNKVRNHKIGVLAIVHDLNMASKYADKVLFLKNGKTVDQGYTEDCFTQENIEETFSHPVQMIHAEDNPFPFVIAGSAENITTYKKDRLEHSIL